MKRSLIILLIAAMLLPCLFLGCDNQEPEATTPVVTTPEVTTPETTTPEEEIVEPPYDGPDITPEGVLKRASVVTTGTSESELYAAQELAKYLSMKKIEVKDGAFPITLSIDETLDNDAFVITATLSGDGAGMTIAGGNERGVLYGVYKFLEELGGVRYFTPDLETVPTTDLTLKEGIVLEYTPYFESRRLNWNCVRAEADWCTKQGVNAHDGATDAKYGGLQTYGSGLFVHTLGALTETGDGLSPNPCLSLDSPEGQKNFQTTLKNLRAALEKDPTMNIASVSQNDKNEYCQCDYCKASYAYYTYHTGDVNHVDYVKNCAEKGGAAGNLLAFVNAIAEELEDEYPNLVIDTLAYNYTQAAPKNIVPRENVCIRVCSIRVCFMHPMTVCPEHKGPNNAQWTRTKLFMTDFVNWGKICDRIYVWDYTTNFRYYIAPFSNFGAIRENMKFYHENGVRGMFPQGNSQSISGEFGELRAYLLAKLMWNPYMSQEEYDRHMNEFLKAYYGAGWVYIRQFIDKTTQLVANADSCINIYEEPLQSISKEEYLANEYFFEELWSKAEAIAGDRAEYVHRSRLQWRCIQILLHPNNEDALAFAEEIEALGIRWAEGDNNNIPIYQMDPFKGLYPDLQPKPEEVPTE
ncbi:MAG: DUF4838 domain-containing protein [Ruminococcaceae bacterium]|nr:DUF4838 domain-containing protein [Oscillospiraceae bacterium]